MIGCSMPNISVMAVFTHASNVFFDLETLPACSRGSMDDFKQACGAHATADTHGDDSVFRLAPAALDQRVAGQARAGHAVGMADRNRTTVDVEFFRIDAELVAAIDHLHRKCLVELPEIDIID